MALEIIHEGRNLVLYTGYGWQISKIQKLCPNCPAKRDNPTGFICDGMSKEGTAEVWGTKDASVDDFKELASCEP